MASFREQMQRLADSIARTRNERKAFLDKNRKECAKKRRELKDQRNQTKLELAHEARSLSKQLVEFKRNNQRTVEKTLRDLRSVRIKAARTASGLLRQEIVRNRRDIVRMLRQNNNDRMRAARQQDRASATTIQSVRAQVQRIRNETKRMTKSLSRDRNDARQIWMRLQNRGSNRWDSGLVSRAMEMSAPTAPTVPATFTVPTTPVIEAANTVSMVDSMSHRPSLLPTPPSMTPVGVS
ncbi:MAG: hypothetical protein MUC43_07620 [Pirellula sp.]|jgi:myosin heavy subunit|nr:hypothetical protein [Pirellula sp.]